MGLKLIKDRGKVRKVWYGQYRDGGSWKVVRLSTPMRGTRIPENLSDQGDDAFERSREKAQEEFDRFEAERSSKGNTEHLTRALIESKSGRKAEDVKLVELAAKWRLIPRSYKPTEDRMKNADRTFAAFIEFSKCTYLYEVTPDIATAFFNKVRNEYAWSSVQGMMSLLKSAFTRFLPMGAQNPFLAVITRNRENATSRINRRPLSEDELLKLLEESKSDAMTHALAITTACTGMRIGDVCSLKWSSIDLLAGFIDVVTSKAGKPVTIPIFDPLRKILEGALAERIDGQEFVFPEAASLYKRNADGIYHRGKVLFARALFAEKAKEESNVVDTDYVEKSPTEILEMIRNAGFTEQKTERCIRIFKMYKGGMSLREIGEAIGMARGQVSGYLHNIQDLTGTKLIKWTEAYATSNTRLLRKTRQARSVGKKSASLFGWHSLRASFVVTAVNHGVPIEMVRKIVGHSTTRMTEEYFNPTKVIIAETMKRRMFGSVIVGNTAPQLEAKPNLASLVANMTPAEREQLKALLG